MSEYGMPYPGMTLVVPAVFILFGDGRAIYNASSDLPGPGTRLHLRQAQLTEAQMDQLLADALGPGGLRDARSEYSFTEFTDLTFTSFEFHAAGVDKRVAAYGLGFRGRDPMPDPNAFTALTALSARLGNFSNDVMADMATDAGVFEPEAYEATLSAVFHEDIVPTANWPWPELATSDFGHAPDGNLVGTVTPSQAAAVLDAGLEQGFFATGDDGLLYVFRLRPLLPDET